MTDQRATATTPGEISILDHTGATAHVRQHDAKDTGTDNASRRVVRRTRWPNYSDYVTTLLIFLASRLVVLLAIAFARRFVPQRSGEFWNATGRWYNYLLRFDSGWYLRICRDGYAYDGNDLIQQPIVFYPLYPLTARVLKSLFRLDENIAVLVISNLAIIIAVLLLFKLIKDSYGRETAFHALALLCFFPTGLFFSAGYTESVALLLIACFFVFLKKEQYFIAAIFAGLTLATRSTGIVLLPPLLWEMWRNRRGVQQQQYRQQFMRFALSASACVVIATSGLWLYMLYLWSAFGKPLAFTTNQRAWRGGTTMGSTFIQSITLQPLSSLANVWQAGVTPQTLDPWFWLSFLLLIIIFWRRLPVSYGLFALGAMLLPYFTVAGSLGFTSFTRYSMLAFPVFVILGDVCRRRLWLGLILTGLSAALMFMYMAMFAEWYWVE